MRKTIAALLLFASTNVLAQEGQFSQYFASSSFLSPAFTGAIPNLSLNSNYKRGGSPNSENFFEMVQTTFTYPFQKHTSKSVQVGGAGISFFQERRGYQGLYSARKVLLNGAYNIKLDQFSNRYFIFGLQGGAVQQRINGNQLQWGSQFNKYFGYDDTRPGEGIPVSSVFYPVFNFGIMYTAFDNQNLYIRDRSFTFGASIDNLNRPVIDYQSVEPSHLNFLYKAFGSVKLPLAPRWHIFPSFYALHSHGNTQVNAGTYLSTFLSSVRSRTAFLMQFGAWYRVGDSVIVLTGFQVENIRLGFSVDLNAQTYNLGTELSNDLPTYEISLTYNLNLSRPLRNMTSPIF